MATDRDQLLAMGFSEARVNHALKQTKYAGLQPAMDWLFAHADDPEPTLEATESATSLGSAAAEEHAGDEIKAEDADAQSLKCDDCNRHFRDSSAAERHAIKTQHLNFSESTEAIKPLTAEEKAAKIERVQELLKIKRAERLAREKEEEKEKEKVRRKTGQELSEIREKVQMQEQQKALAERERQKHEDRIAKERIRAQLEADKLERARQAEERKRGAQSMEPAKTAAPVISASHSETRIQIRLPDGQPPLTQVFNVDDTFGTLLKVLGENRTIRPGFKLVTTFPRKTLGEGDKAKTLKELNLVPSAALVGQY